MHALLFYSGIALAITAILAAGLGWIVAGRVLRPLRTITEAVRDISATSLHRRLALDGPGDELKRLGDTFDGLLARLDGAFDAQRRFVANASHELRTPLTVSRALLQAAATDPHATAAELRATCREAIAPADVHRLLEPFQRGNSRHPHGDAGLGLSIVQAIATAHDATLTTSPQPGGGLDVTVSFPPRSTRRVLAAQRGLSTQNSLPCGSASTVHVTSP
jgi:signal transduction histidine kinase